MIKLLIVSQIMKVYQTQRKKKKTNYQTLPEQWYIRKDVLDHLQDTDQQL